MGCEKDWSHLGAASDSMRCDQLATRCARMSPKLLYNAGSIWNPKYRRLLGVELKIQCEFWAEKWCKMLQTQAVMSHRSVCVGTGMSRCWVCKNMNLRNCTTCTQTSALTKIQTHSSDTKQPKLTNPRRGFGMPSVPQWALFDSSVLHRTHWYTGAGNWKLQNHHSDVQFLHSIGWVFFSLPARRQNQHGSETCFEKKARQEVTASDLRRTSHSRWVPDTCVCILRAQCISENLCSRG